MSPRLSICRHGLRPSGQPCRACTREDNLRRARRNRAYGYSSWHWQQLRRRRLELDGYSCQLKLGRCTNIATHVHLKPELEGNHLAATIDDCVSCCANCSGSVDAPRAHTDPGGSFHLYEDEAAVSPRNSDLSRAPMRGQE